MPEFNDAEVQRRKLRNAELPATRRKPPAERTRSPSRSTAARPPTASPGARFGSAARPPPSPLRVHRPPRSSLPRRRRAPPSLPLLPRGGCPDPPALAAPTTGRFARRRAATRARAPRAGPRRADLAHVRASALRRSGATRPASRARAGRPRWCRGPRRGTRRRQTRLRVRVRSSGTTFVAAAPLHDEAAGHPAATRAAEEDGQLAWPRQRQHEPAGARASGTGAARGGSARRAPLHPSDTEVARGPARQPPGPAFRPYPSAAGGQDADASGAPRPAAQSVQWESRGRGSRRPPAGNVRRGRRHRRPPRQRGRRDRRRRRRNRHRRSRRRRKSHGRRHGQRRGRRNSDRRRRDRRRHGQGGERRERARRIAGPPRRQRAATPRPPATLATATNVCTRTLTQRLSRPNGYGRPVYSGMFPCLRRGRGSRFVSAVSSATRAPAACAAARSPRRRSRARRPSTGSRTAPCSPRSARRAAPRRRPPPRAPCGRRC